MATNQPVSGRTNPDAITGAPASHPGATAIGTASGTATGAAIGMVGGPIGIAVGGIVGGVVGGIIGHTAGEWHDPSDLTYWKNEYKNRPYVDRFSDFDTDLAPAYRYGSNLGLTQAGNASRQGFDAFDDSAKADWVKVRDQSKLSYEQARDAMSDAYSRKVRNRETISDNDNIAT